MSVISTRRIGITITTIAGFTAAVSTTDLQAQEDPEDRTNTRLLECDRIADPAARLQCFDVVVRGLNEPAGPPQESRAEPPPQESQPEAPPVQRAAPQEPPPAVPAATSGNVATAPPAASNTGSSAVIGTRTEALTGPGEDVGEAVALQKAATEDSPEVVRAKIVEVWTMNNGRFVARLDNGQVWRETEASRVRTPKAGSSVVITEGRFGSYRMKIDNDNRRAGVRRTE